MIVDQPVPGFYRMRRSARHPWAAVSIFYYLSVDPLTGEELLERPRPLTALLNDRPVSPAWAWTWCAEHPITADEYHYLLTLSRMPGLPEASPDKPIDLNRLPPVYQRRIAK